MHNIQCTYMYPCTACYASPRYIYIYIVCICICICVCTCMYTLICIFMRVPLYVHIYIYMYIRTHVNDTPRCHRACTKEESAQNKTQCEIQVSAPWHIHRQSHTQMFRNMWFFFLLFWGCFFVCSTSFIGRLLFVGALCCAIELYV